MKAALPLLILVLLATAASAVNIGVSPGTLGFPRMMKGGYAEKSLLVSASIQRNLTTHVSFAGNVASWIRVFDNETSFNISEGRPYTLRLVVEPPPDVQTGNYSGMINILTDSVAGISSGSGSSIRAGVSVPVSIEVVGQEIRNCIVEKMRMPFSEVGSPVEFFAIISNTGNVRISPRVELNIWDQNQKNIVKTLAFLSKEVLPTRSESISQVFDNNLPLGQYWADIVIRDCKATSLLTFTIGEKGTVSDDASLEGIYTKPWYYVGDYVDVNSVFINQGPRNVLASFKGQVTLNDKVVALLQSDEIQVEPQKVQTFVTYFTPRINGTYQVNGRVYYNKKLTYEKGVSVNVASKPEGESTPIIPALFYLAILGLIIFLIIKIRQERKKS